MSVATWILFLFNFSKVVTQINCTRICLRLRSMDGLWSLFSVFFSSSFSFSCFFIILFWLFTIFSIWILFVVSFFFSSFYRRHHFAAVSIYRNSKNSVPRYDTQKLICVSNQKLNCIPNTKKKSFSNCTCIQSARKFISLWVFMYVSSSDNIHPCWL